MNTKTCIKCKEIKEVSLFVKSTKTRYKNTCVTCDRICKKHYYNSNKEEINNKRREKYNIHREEGGNCSYYENNRDKILKELEWKRIHNICGCLLKGAKIRAKSKGLPFDITIDDIVIPDICPVLGIPLHRNSGKAGPSSPTLDRIIPERGYVKGNVRVISYRANQIKNDGNAEEHLKVAEYIKNSLLTYNQQHLQSNS